MHKLPIRSTGLSIALALGMAVLAGCGDGKPPATQVVAKVNKDEITSHQIDYIASKTRLTPEQAPEARRKILDLLVDQQLAVQQAMDRKLDRSPEVIAAVDLAKREILARAYYSQLAGEAGQPGEAESKAFYAQHPELFAQRRIFAVEEITLGVADAPKDFLKEQVAANKSIAEISALLKARNVAHTANAAKLGSEQVPPGVLPKLREFRDGQMGIIETPQAVYVMRVVASQPAPVDEKTAQEPIRRLLAMQRDRDAVTRTMAELKQKANIEYLGEYAGSVPKPVAQAPATQPADRPVAAAKPAPAESVPPVASSATVETNIAVQPSASSIQKAAKGLR